MIQALVSVLAVSTVALLASCRGDHVSATPEKHPDEVAATQRADAPARPAAKAELGKVAPDFALQDLDGKVHKLADYRGKVVVLEWFNPTCPYCVYAYSKGPLADMPERYREKGIVWLSVNSDGPGKPGADVEKNKSFVTKHEMKAPLLFDATGAVGKSFGAKTTPHMFVIDEKGVLVYRGALDNAPLGRVDRGGDRVDYVDAAIADMKSGRAVTRPETKSYG